MARRGRHRSQSAKRVVKGDRPARVRVDDETWREFRMGVVGESSVAAYLGQIVEAEVGRYRARVLRQDRVTNTELIAAVDRAAALRDELVELVNRLQWRMRHGGP